MMLTQEVWRAKEKESKTTEPIGDGDYSYSGVTSNATSGAGTILVGILGLIAFFGIRGCQNQMDQERAFAVNERRATERKKQKGPEHRRQVLQREIARIPNIQGMWSTSYRGRNLGVGITTFVDVYMNQKGLRLNGKVVCKRKYDDMSRADSECLGGLAGRIKGNAVHYEIDFNSIPGEPYDGAMNACRTPTQDCVGILSEDRRSIAGHCSLEYLDTDFQYKRAAAPFAIQRK